MIAAIMQPYFFPHLPYFQLLASCDLFVLHDDVQYIRGGWINRNRILQDGAAAWLTVPVRYAPHRERINARYYQLDRRTVGRILRRLEAAYRLAPSFAAVFPVVVEIMGCPDANVATFNAQLVRRVAAFLEITTPIVVSSQLGEDVDAAGAERVIRICKRVGASRYVNPVDGMKLYLSEQFAANGIGLSAFISSISQYEQFGRKPVQSLSILDVMMFNEVDDIRRLLRQCRVVEVRGTQTGESDGFEMR